MCLMLPVEYQFIAFVGPFVRREKFAIYFLGPLNETCGNQTNVTHYFVWMEIFVCLLCVCVYDKNRLAECARARMRNRRCKWTQSGTFFCVEWDDGQRISFWRLTANTIWLLEKSHWCVCVCKYTYLSKPANKTDSSEWERQRVRAYVIQRKKKWLKID